MIKNLLMQLKQIELLFEMVGKNFRYNERITMNKEIIFPESDKAASFVKVEGWVSRGGYFYGKDERTARWDGATYVHCNVCGKPCPKNWPVCDTCREREAEKKYLQFPLKVWDESVPVYSYVKDKYYWIRDEVRDAQPDDIFDSFSLQLVLCKPIYPPGIDPEAFYEDLLPEYNELSDVSQDLVDIFQELNNALTETLIILSYEPISVAAI